MRLSQSSNSFSASNFAQSEWSNSASIPRYGEEYLRNRVLEVARKGALEIEKGRALEIGSRSSQESIDSGGSVEGKVG